MTNCFIINYNRLTCVQNMLAYLKQIPEINPIIIDNGSTFPALLDWYSTKPCEIDLVGKNCGELVMFVTDRIERYNLKAGGYIITDPDLDLTSVPLDFVDVLKRGLELHPWADKCGLGLRIDDLPDTEIAQAVRNHEAVHWAFPLGDNMWRAAIDTTTSYFRSSIQSFECVRTGGAYQARHIDWYYTDYSQLPDDYIYYLKSIGNQHSHWSKEIKRRAGL